MNDYVIKWGIMSLTTKNVLTGLSGWANGFNFAVFSKLQREIETGTNYLLSSPIVWLQFGFLADSINKIGQLAPHPMLRGVNWTTKIAFFSSLPFFVGLAAIRQKHYETIRDKLVEYSPRYGAKLPKKLSARTLKIVDFITSHQGKGLLVAMVVSSIALIYLGNPVSGGAQLAALSYRAIDGLGFVPFKISLFVEKYLPLISETAGLIEGNFFTASICAIQLIGRIGSLIDSPILFNHAQHVVCIVARKILVYAPKIFLYFIGNNFRHAQIVVSSCNFLAKKIISEKESSIPVVTNRNMTYLEINTILDGKDSDYEMNVVHSSKLVTTIAKFGEDRNYKQYNTLFNSISWGDKKYEGLIVNKLRADQQFIDFLGKKFPGAPLGEYKDKVSFDRYLEELARENKQSKDEYLSTLIKEQMSWVVDVLNGIKTPSGQRQDVEVAQQLSATILWSLSQGKGIGQMELEDILLKIAVEGGHYCARGLRRTFFEINNSLINSSDPTEAYELKMQQSLLNLRYRIVQKYTQHILSYMGNDTHGDDLVSAHIPSSFYPKTVVEKRRLNLTNIFDGIGVRELMFRAGLHSEYETQMYSVFDDMDRIHFGPYVANIINANTSLSQNEKNVLIEKFTERNGGSWTTEETLHKFQRWVLVALGVLRVCR